MFPISTRRVNQLIRAASYAGRTAARSSESWQSRPSTLESAATKAATTRKLKALSYAGHSDADTDLDRSSRWRDHHHHHHAHNIADSVCRLCVHPLVRPRISISRLFDEAGLFL